MESLTPGENIDLVLNPAASEDLDVRRTLLLEIDLQRGVVVGQPSRKIMESTGVQRVEATIVQRDRQSKKYTRMGFYATIDEFIASYELVNGTQEALVLALPHEVHEANLRSWYRVQVPRSLTPMVYLLNKRKEHLNIDVDIIDLSAKGALISYRRSRGTRPLFSGGETTLCEINLVDTLERLPGELSASQANLAHFQIPCRIVRTYEKPDLRRHYAALVFLNLTKQQEDLLHMAILKIQQFLVSRGIL